MVCAMCLSLSVVGGGRFRERVSCDLGGALVATSFPWLSVCNDCLFLLCWCFLARVFLLSPRPCPLCFLPWWFFPLMPWRVPPLPPVPSHWFPPPKSLSPTVKGIQLTGLFFFWETSSCLLLCAVGVSAWIVCRRLLRMLVRRSCVLVSRNVWMCAHVPWLRQL